MPRPSDSEILHYPDACVTGPYRQPGCEMGPGFTFYAIRLAPGMVFGGLVSRREAEKLCALYRKGTPRGEIRAAWTGTPSPADRG